MKFSPIMGALVLAAAVVTCVARVAAAPSAFVLTIANATTNSYVVAIDQGGEKHEVRLSGRLSETLRLKIASASLSIEGPGCNVT